MHFVEEAVAEHKDLAQLQFVAFRDDTAPFTQSCERVRGREGLLKDPKGT
jgi:hypothetical protein